jgi:glycosyltransferase involved in cell wall biosynthesis
MKNNDYDIELILIEHGEDEFSKEHAEKTGFTYKWYNDPLLTSHRSTLRNEAVKMATGEYVILHDNDIIPDPTFFDDIIKVLNKNKKIKYFSNFKHVINLNERLTDTLIEDMKTTNKYSYGYINGTDPHKTKNFHGLQVRPHGFFTFTEATGGSFTIEKKTYMKAPFDESYKQWGAEDNAFKLFMIKEIGWERFGMLDKDLLHSFHTTMDYNPQLGIIKMHNDSLLENRDKLYSSINEISDELNTHQYTEKKLEYIITCEKEGK